jgi:hypothetical protein
MIIKKHFKIIQGVLLHHTPVNNAFIDYSVSYRNYRLTNRVNAGTGLKRPQIKLLSRPKIKVC